MTGEAWELRQDLEGVAALAAQLLEHDDADLAPYAQDIAHAYDGLAAVDDHLPQIIEETASEQ